MKPIAIDDFSRRPLTCERDILPQGDKRLLHRESGEKRKKLTNPASIF